jgi:hypothetical protein
MRESTVLIFYYMKKVGELGRCAIYLLKIFTCPVVI